MNIPNPSMIKDLQLKDHSLSDCELFSEHGLKLFYIELERCKELYSEYGMPLEDVSFEFIPLLSEIERKEKPIKKKLEALSKKIVFEFFNVPDDFEIKGEIDTEYKPNLDFNPPDASHNDLERLEEQINKRRLINSITHGAAVYLWKTIYFMVEDKINELDSDLFDMYCTMTSTNELLKFTTPFLREDDMGNFFNAMSSNEMNPNLGINELVFDEKGNTSIKAKGRNFCILIHEQIKGLMEVFSLHGIDQELSGDDLKIVLDVADNYREEMYHYFFGPALWSLMLEKEKVFPQDIPKLLQKFYVLDYKDMVSYFNDML